MYLQTALFKRVVMTGASGFIGSQIVPKLVADGIPVLLVGRDADRLKRQFPLLPVCDYTGLAGQLHRDDLLVHMAVLNNDASTAHSAEDFNSVNVGLLSDVLAAARGASVRRVVNLSSFHALGPAGSAYAESKRAALAVARSSGVAADVPVQVVNLFLPAVYGDRFAGRLAPLNRCPAMLRGAVLAAVSAILPTVHIDRIRAFVVDQMSGAPIRPDVFLAEPQSKNPVFRFGKRVIDLSFALMILLPFLWLFAGLWVWIKLDSQGPGFFAQPRIGKDGRVFVCYKFRTMRQGTQQVGTHEVAASAVTKVGAFLRRTKLDELPQAWNLLVGDMSLVGPRPCLPVQTTLIEERRQRGVLDILPGITGLAQVNNIDMSDPVKLAEWDARSIAQQGLLAEIRIILRTFLGGGQGDKVRG